MYESSYGDSNPSGGGLTRRRVNTNATSYGMPSGPRRPSPNNRTTSALKKIDIFPKLHADYSGPRTSSGGAVTVGLALPALVMLVLAELYAHVSSNGTNMEHIRVDTSLQERIRINLNVTFPNLACEDLHLDVMDVAGDSQIGLEAENGFVKTKLGLDGDVGKFGAEGSEKVKANKEHLLEKMDEDKRHFQDPTNKLPKDYCGDCYGAKAPPNATKPDCCNTCDELTKAYEEANWGTSFLQNTAEQCKREGVVPLKRMKHGEGCNFAGFMTVNKVAGNFHIAMGESTVRDGRHIHQFLPEDAPNFNASHIIHELSFGTKYPSMEDGPLVGVQKMTSEENGGTGLFQYFLKVVPTNYINDIESITIRTNRYSYTEKFRPLMVEVEDHHHDLGHGEHAGVHTDEMSHSKHKVASSILPGVFFIYELYPFAVEVSTTRIPFSHFLIRAMAVVGGVLTLSSWVDSILHAKNIKMAS
mmetsp:Transcript_16450/g.32695  ORF Transcript_16450/g.32695 Transcript_16450/m.32695 type:complete len:472 (-) Transcript_16450:217-1632(-)